MRPEAKALVEYDKAKLIEWQAVAAGMTTEQKEAMVLFAAACDPCIEFGMPAEKGIPYLDFGGEVWLKERLEMYQDLLAGMTTETT